MLSCYTYTYDGIEEGYPCHMKPNVSITFSLGLWGRSVKIMEEIAKNFGGGFVRENDCDDEDWFYVEGENNLSEITDKESKLFAMLSKKNNGLVSLDDYKVVDFVMEHLDEIKAL
jgi:hypothetical protein